MEDASGRCNVMNLLIQSLSKLNCHNVVIFIVYDLLLLRGKLGRKSSYSK